MNESVKLKKYQAGFNCLSEDGKKCVLAIQQALLFAQKNANLPQAHKDELLDKKKRTKHS